MKKILLLTICLISLTVFSQIPSLIPQSKVQRGVPFERSNKEKRYFENLKPRSFTENYFLNYSYFEQSRQKSSGAGSYFFSPFVELNSNFTKVHFGSLTDLLQIVGNNNEIYDIFGFNSGTQSYVYRTIDLTKTNLKLDSFVLPYRHIRTKAGVQDTLIVSIYDRSLISIPNAVVTGNYPNWTSTSITYPATTLYSETVYLNSQAPIDDTVGTTNPYYYTLHKFKPNLTLPAGKSFALRVQFKSDTGNYIAPMFHFRDECNSTCLSSPAFAFNTTGFLNQTYNLQDADPANDIPYNGTLNVQGIFFVCQNDETCEFIQAQNLAAQYFLTSTTDFNVRIDPVSNILGCSGTTLKLDASSSGKDTLHTLTMRWQAGRGTFENGKDTITSTGPTYTFDTMGGAVNIILTGTTSIGEVAKDTLQVRNMSMTPNLTTTGKISCDPKDSVRMAIANSAAVGINSSLVSFYDGLTSLNLATNLNDFNRYFGIKYEWTGTGLYPRTDTTFTNTKTAGTFNLKITNFAGCTKTISRTFTNIANPPTLDFSFTPSSNICPNKDITFTVASSAVRAGWTYNWSESTTSLATSGNSITHKFPNGGSFSVKLNADSSGCQATQVSKNVTVLAATAPACKVSISSVYNDNIQIYPNPVRDGKVYIQNDMNQSLSYRVTDMLGKVVSADKLVSNKESQVDLSSAPNGIYFIEIESKGEKMVKKIIVDKQ